MAKSRPTITFICTFNACRSVVAEHFLRKLLLDKNIELSRRVEITSAGVVSKEVSENLKQNRIPEPQFGNGCHHQVIEIASKRGIDISTHRSKLFEEALAEKADLIITMEKFQKREILSHYPHKDGMVFTFREFFGISGPTIIEDSFTLPEFDSVTGHYGFPYEFDEQAIAAVEECLSQGLNKLCGWFER
jgi:protein-tyrosine-phosphatase